MDKTEQLQYRKCVKFSENFYYQYMCNKVLFLKRNM